jgi:exopolyphosphatase/guanosine-5'-triphosphate,3'-diphosphate pyrophosphatase
MAEVAAAVQRRVGLAYWMHEVLDQCAKAAVDFTSDPVHDLRTALRRCRSLADGITVFDPDPAWKKMRKAGKQLFSRLGDLRDTQVMRQWVETLAPEPDSVAKSLTDFLAAQEPRLKKAAATTLQNFDVQQWQAWASELPSRAARISPDSPVFAHLALERWHEARLLHRRASRNRGNTTFHDLRIGLKRFRYTVENFLPTLHSAWGKDIKALQDLLGEVHDFDVLWQTAVNIKAFPDPEIRARWRSRILQERQQRLDAYRAKASTMAKRDGSDSLWSTWRTALPRPEELRSLALERLEIWASFHDSGVTHARHVSGLALQLYDRIAFEGIPRGSQPETYRHVLQAAALMHHVGRRRGTKIKIKTAHHKRSARLIRQLAPPLGWTADELRLTALVARYHRGALPRQTQRNFGALPASQQRLVQFLSGLLRLACGFDHQHDGQIRSLQVECLDPVLTIEADGYTEYTSIGEHLAAARHLLELACHRPIFILPRKPQSQPHAA